jgi:hypothetical protein
VYDGVYDDDLGLGVKKLGYYTYKKMTEMLEGADWSTVTMLWDGAEADHIYLFGIEKNSQTMYIAWWDYFNETYTEGDTRSLVLEGVTRTHATATSVVPSADTGQEVSDYATAFQELLYTVSDGEVTITLGEDPIIITVFDNDPDEGPHADE